jgi:hypothetical protein
VGRFIAHAFSCSTRSTAWANETCPPYNIDSRYLATVAIHAKSRFLGFARNDKTRVFGSVTSQAPLQRALSRVESPHFFENGRGFRRALFEWRAPMLINVQDIFRHELRSPACFQRSAGTALLLRGYSSGSPFFAYFLWRSKESEWPPGHPRQISLAQPNLDPRLRGEDG